VFHGGLDANPGGPLQIGIDVLKGGTIAGHADVTTTADRVDAKITLASPQLWSPESPNLYEVRYTLSGGNDTLDTVQSYMGSAP